MKGFIKLSVLLLVALSSLLIGCGSGSSNSGSSEKVYTITFDPNGGSGGPAAVDATYGKPMPQLSAAEAPAPPTGSGSYFAGYYDEQNGGTMYYTAQLKPAKEYWDKTSNTTLYARWTQTEEAVIIYYKNDGGSETKTQTVELNASVNLQTNTFTRNGYTFSGWATSVTGAVEYADGANYTASLTSIALYAVWSVNEPGKVVITFHKNDGTNETTIQTVSENTTIALTANTFTRGTSYTFSGWATSLTGAVEYADGANYTVTTTGVNLYAVWTSTSTSATIVFHSNFGSDETKTQTVEQNVSTALDANTFTRTAEYIFLGWSLSSTATSATYLEGANYTATESSVNLYAVWTSVPLRVITFHKNDESGENVIQQVPENTISNLAMNTFTRATHIFLGWSDTSSGSVLYVDGAEYPMGNANVNFYAVWANKRIITFNGNGGSIPITGDVTKTQEAPEGRAIALETNTFERENCYFVGWSPASGGTVEYTDGANYTASSSDIDLYAMWRLDWEVIEIKDSVVGMSMIWIPAGTFQMGSPTDEPDRSSSETQHLVTLTTGFYMGKYQVTQDEYEAVMGSGSNPSYFNGEPGFASPYTQYRDTPSGETQGKRPVEQVSWYDALVFCNKLSEKEGFTPAYSMPGFGNSTDPDYWGTVPTSSDATWNAVEIVSGSTGYRLPTEAQWEYACRAGTTTAYHTGVTIDTTTGWYSSNSNSRTHQVGWLKAVNGFGLYDMHGNVYEWCWDWYDSGYYGSSPSSDPEGPVSGSNRVVRGGYWYGNALYLRSACRVSYGPNYGYNNIGFRVVRP